MIFRLSKNVFRNKQELNGKQVAVLGAARSGIAVSILLAKSGASVLLSDLNKKENLHLPLEKLNEQGIQVETGGHSSAILKSGLICISPGISLDIPILRQALEKGIPVLGEIEIASWFCKSPIIAITGSNGKTTTTSLTGQVLKTTNPEVVVAGNIGQPFAESVTETDETGVVVLEVSSFQLETIFTFHPQIVVIMNLTENHLDRYPDFDTYAAAKLNILNNITSNDLVIYNRDDGYLSKHLAHRPFRKLGFSLRPFEGEGVFWQGDSMIIRMNGKENRMKLNNGHLKGPHNRYNIMVAAMIGQLMGVSAESIQTAVEKFPGIEHRLEEVRRLGGLLFINDSKATTVESLSFALQSFEEKIVLIAGGKDKGGDFTKVQSLLKSRVKSAVLIGQASARMTEAWKGIVPLFPAESLKEAVQIAREKSSPGDVVLLSPACSSFDMFRDYEDRGNQFKKIVRDLS